MTMYLPNPDLHPTGSEPGEFIDVHPLAAEAGGTPDVDEGVRWTATADGPPSSGQRPPGA